MMGAGAAGARPWTSSETAEGVALSETRLDATCTFKGHLDTADDLLVEGKVEGTIQSTAKVIVAANACVDGRISGREVEVAGTVKGDVVASGRFRLASTGRIEGDVKAEHMSVEDGGVLHGKVLADSGPAPARPSS
jgi:cytoskeletal protein CcmA (bactofilin family)